MSLELAQRLATEAMSHAVSTQGDTLMTLGQARARMDIETVLPTAPIKLLDEVRCSFGLYAFNLREVIFFNSHSKYQSLMVRI